MTLKTALETSVVIFSLRNFIQVYLFLENKIREVYPQSQICRLINRLIEPVYLSYNFSYLKGLVGAVEEGSSAFFYTSRFTQWIKNSYRKLEVSLSNKLNTSSSGKWAVDVKKEFSLYSIKAVSIILIISVAVNFLLAFIFRQELSTRRLIILSAFLVTGLLGLLCDADWATVKRDSIVLRILFR